MNIISSLQHTARLCVNELLLIAQMYRYYKWGNLVNLLMTIADFIWWMILIEGGTFNATKIAPLALGYVVWAFANYIIYDANNVMSEMAQTGVLEQLYISNTQLHHLLLIRCIAATIVCSIEQLLVLIAVFLVFPVSIPLSFSLLILGILTLMGIFGFAFMVAGIGLIFKRSQPFCYMINNILLFLNGSILPIENMHPIVQFISKSLPTTQGIYLMKQLCFEGQNLQHMFMDGSIAILSINSLMYLTAGWLIVSYCQRYAQEKGIIGHY